LRNNAALREAAMTYWTKRGEKPVVTAPTGMQASRWREERLIKDGLAKRGQLHYIPNGGHTVYKGEHITAARISGEPVHENFDVSKASTPSVWAYQEILPERMYAIPVLEQVPVAAPFDPSITALENTVVLFGPRPDLAAVPFDAVLLSTVYSYFHVIGGRRSYQNKIRGHIYASAVAALPWNDAIAGYSGSLETIRNDLLIACERRYEQASTLLAEATALGLLPLRDVVRSHTGSRVIKGEAFATNPDLILEIGAIVEVDGGWCLSLDAEAEHTITFSEETLAVFAKSGLRLAEGNELSWNDILCTPVPASEEMAKALEELRKTYSTDRLEKAIDDEIEKIDLIVGPALGLSVAEVQEVRREMLEDPFLAHVRPRFPFFRPRQYGRRLNLERHDRYA
jgi:hypothetical protein